MQTVKTITPKAIQTVQGHTHAFTCSNKATSVNFASSIFSEHSSINLSTNLFLHLQFSLSKYSPTLHDLSHSHSQLLGFHAYPLSQSILYIRINICHHSNIVYYYKHFHLIYIYTYTFHATFCVLLH